MSRNQRADGWGIMNRVHDNLTDIAGIKSSTGTTSERKNEIKQLKLELENVQRDEQRYSHAIANIESANDGRYAEQYADAFRYKPVKDADGNLTYQKETPDNYNEWVAKRLNLDMNKEMTDIRNILSGDSSFMAMSAEDQQKEIQKELNIQLDSYARNSDVISRQQYESVDALYNMRNKADLEGKKIERNITKKQEQIDSNKKKS